MFKIGNLVKDINPGWVNYNNKGRIVSISGDTIIWLNNRTNRFTIDNKKNLQAKKKKGQKIELRKYEGCPKWQYNDWHTTCVVLIYTHVAVI